MIGGHRRRIEPRSIVLDLDMCHAVARRRANGDAAAVAPRRDGVFHRVFDERLEREARHQRVLGGSINRQLRLHPAAEPHAFDVQVIPDGPQLVGQRNERAVGGVERRAQQRGKLCGHALRPARIARDEGGDRIEGIEQKVRLHARLERGELGLECGATGLCLIPLLRAHGELSRLEAGAHQFVRGNRDTEGEGRDNRVPRRPEEPAGEVGGRNVADSRQDGDSDHGAHHRKREQGGDEQHPVDREALSPQPRADAGDDGCAQRADRE